MFYKIPEQTMLETNSDLVRGRNTNGCFLMSTGTIWHFLHPHHEKNATCAGLLQQDAMMRIRSKHIHTHVDIRDVIHPC